jgi:hypothetical protein
VLFAPGNKMGGRTSSSPEARGWALVRPVLLGEACSETGGKERCFLERSLVRCGKVERFLSVVERAERFLAHMGRFRAIFIQKRTFRVISGSPTPLLSVFRPQKREAPPDTLE